MDNITVNYKARFNIIRSLINKHTRNMYRNSNSIWYKYIIYTIFRGVIQYYKQAQSVELPLSNADAELPIFLRRSYPKLFINGRLNGNNRNYKKYAENLITNIRVRVRNRSIPNTSSNTN